MGNASTKDYISTLNDLIESCKDGEQGFREAGEAVQRTDLRTLFGEYSRQRAQFASDLQMAVTRIGGDAEKSGSVSGAMHRGWMNLKGSVSTRDDHSILEEVERGEDSAVKSYQTALGKELPSDLRTIVDTQYRQILEAHQQVRTLRDNTAQRVHEPAGTRL